MEYATTSYIIKKNQKGYYVGYQDPKDRNYIRMVSQTYKTEAEALDYKENLQSILQMDKAKKAQKIAAAKINCTEDIDLALLLFLEKNNYCWAGTASELQALLSEMEELYKVPGRTHLGRTLLNNETKIKDAGIESDRDYIKKPGGAPFRCLTIWDNNKATHAQAMGVKEQKVEEYKIEAAKYADEEKARLKAKRKEKEAAKEAEETQKQEVQSNYTNYTNYTPTSTSTYSHKYVGTDASDWSAITAPERKERRTVIYRKPTIEQAATEPVAEPVEPAPQEKPKLENILGDNNLLIEANANALFELIKAFNTGKLDKKLKLTIELL